jgi:hypothetical protein
MSSKKRETRAPIGKQSSVNKMDDAEKTRMATGPQLRIDTSHYERMEEYRDMQLFGALSDGDVDRWLALGAKPVPRVSKSSKIYKGINDRMDTEYQVYPSVSVVEGRPVDMFLLFMPREDYKKYKIDPLEKRNEEIRHAMGIGRVDSEAVVMSNVKGLKTYAPNTGNGSTGLDVQRGGELTHDV